MLFAQANLLNFADTADGGATVGALSLGDGLAVFGNALNRIGHDLFLLALYAVCFDSHMRLTSLFYC